MNLKARDIIWDSGCDQTSEWVFASLETGSHRQRLVSWLSSKGVAPESECIKVNTGWKEPKPVRWKELLDAPEDHFGEEMFELIDLDLRWLMEYQTQEIARFGRYK